MSINGNGQQIQVCNLLIFNTTNFACLNWHVARHLTKKIEISPIKKCPNLTPKNFVGVGNSAGHFESEFSVDEAVLLQDLNQFNLARQRFRQDLWGYRLVSTNNRGGGPGFDSRCGRPLPTG